MTTRTAQLAIALALTSSMVIAQSLAAPACIPGGGAGCFKKGTRPHTVRQYYNYAPRAKQPNDDPYIKAIWEEAIGQ
jgi:hypothetical protein